MVAMFYTSCQYMCPLIVESGKVVERQLDAAQRARLGVVLISMDPARDTPAALQKVATQRGVDGGRWLLAAPPAAKVREVAGVLGVRYKQLPNGDFNHSSVLILLDADGRILARTEKIGSVPDPDFLAAVRKTVGG
jgi:protein SCO1/2